MSYHEYLKKLDRPHRKAVRLEFLNPDGRTAFYISGEESCPRARALLQDGELNCALNNGRRRRARLTLENAGGDYEFAVNRLWFGQEIRLYEGIWLDSGKPYYIPQGVFLAENPEELLYPDRRTVQLKLADKWALLDGSLGGRLEGDYLVRAGSSVFDAMAALLRLDRRTGLPDGPRPIDPQLPVFTTYFRGRSQTLSDGRELSLTELPHDIVVPAGGSLADVLLSLADTLAARIGYDACGRLRVEPSAADIDAGTRPVLYSFSTQSPALLGMHYTARGTDVFNDCIVVGGSTADLYTPRARAQNLDPSSGTCVSRIGLKTRRFEMPNYYSAELCRSYAEWQLKRAAVPVNTVELECRQMFHITENGVVTVRRSDRPGSPVERHMVQGFTRPMRQDDSMTLSLISTGDFPEATIIEDTGGSE